MPRNGSKKGVDQSRKLPDYEEMKRLYLETGLTYKEIAEKYDCVRSVVVATMRARAERRGEWPLKAPNLAERLSVAGLKRFEERRVDARRLRNWLILRLELANEGVDAFGGRHHLSREVLYKLKRGDLEEVDKDWAEKLRAALAHDARAAEEACTVPMTGPDGSYARVSR